MLNQTYNQINSQHHVKLVTFYLFFLKKRNFDSDIKINHNNVRWNETVKLVVVHRP